MAQVVLLREAWNLGETNIQRYLQLTLMEDNDAGPTSNSLPVMVLVGSYFTMYHGDQKICALKPKVNTTSSRLCFFMICIQLLKSRAEWDEQKRIYEQINFKNRT